VTANGQEGGRKQEDKTEGRREGEGVAEGVTEGTGQARQVVMQQAQAAADEAGPARLFLSSMSPLGLGKAVSSPPA
jgi:hypothetical protein